MIPDFLGGPRVVTRVCTGTQGGLSAVVLEAGRGEETDSALEP